MAIRPFLAMTAAEIREDPFLSCPLAWMACHFSPNNSGLSNLPRCLPEGSLLMLNDSTPIQGHDPAQIARQLEECASSLGCLGIVLDFQRPGSGETAALAGHLVQALPCPVAVSDCYAENLTCPVFLSPSAPSMALADHIAPWKGREIWLDISPAGEVITLTGQGAEAAYLPHPDLHAPGFADDSLHCHYCIRTEEEKAVFTLWRTWEDLKGLIEEAENLGVSKVLGLYQEFCSVGRGYDPADALPKSAGFFP